MPELLFALAVICAVFLGEQVRRLRSRTRRQEQQLKALADRVTTLEKRQGIAFPAPPPEMVQPERARRISQDWEAVVGANWLNRLGALILVIGIALFLGYSLTQLGPAGKIGVGAAAGASLLAAGMAIEPRQVYRAYSFSLMAAGWAVLYFAAYASYGVPAARVIESPVLAVLLLILVSAGMIGHALRYRSETAVALAYLLGFAGLNVTPPTPLSVIATLILAVSLIGIAYRFDWFRLPLLGAVLAYSGFVLRYETSAFGQAALWVYWAAFEAYDLLDVRRRGRARGIERTLFLVNAIGFLGASVLHEWRMGLRGWSLYFGGAAAAYVLSAFFRARWTEGSNRPRPLEGGYEAAAALGALLMAAALVERFTGVVITLALVFEGELVFLAGLSLRSVFLQRAGMALLALPVFRAVLVDPFSGTSVDMSGLHLHRSTPPALAVAGVLALNRYLAGTGWYLCAASALVLVSVGSAELPSLWVAPVIAVAGAVLVLTGLADLAFVGAAALAFAALRAAVVNVPETAILTSSVVVAALYAGQLRWRRAPAWLRPGLSLIGTLLLTALIYKAAPGHLFTITCGAEGAVLLAVGFLLQERIFRLSGLGIFLLCLGRLFAWDLRALDTVSRILSFIVLGVVLLAASWVYTRFRDKLRNLL